MKRFWTLLLLFVPHQSIHAQEVKHAPTVEQCRADQKLRLSRLEEPGGAGVAYVTYNELSGWSSEMLQCAEVDSRLESRYANTMGEINAEQLLRVQRFLNRHNLFNQFIAEDAQGQH